MGLAAKNSGASGLSLISVGANSRCHQNLGHLGGGRDYILQQKAREIGLTESPLKAASQ